jgi:hypothetical protein
MNHAMYTTQTRQGYSSTCFLKEPWRIKEKLAMEENIPKTDSMCYCVLIVMEATNKCRTYEALEKVKAFFYEHSVTDADREHILGLEKSYFQLRQNSAKKQKTMYDFFV